MQNLAIFGAGGFGREVALLVHQLNAIQPQWNLLGFFDDGKQPGDSVDGLKVLGGVKQLNAVEEPIAVVVALADPEVRKSVVDKVRSERISFPVICHPQSNLGSASNRIGRGSIITAGCILTTGIALGEFVIVNLSSTLGHDVTLGDFVSIMPGSNLSGNVKIGASTLIGTGVKILQNISLGSHCKVGAGAVVTRSFAGGLTLVGVPAHEKITEHV